MGLGRKSQPHQYIWAKAMMPRNRIKIGLFCLVPNVALIAFNILVVIRAEVHPPWYVILYSSLILFLFVVMYWHIASMYVTLPDKLENLEIIDVGIIKKTSKCKWCEFVPSQSPDVKHPVFLMAYDDNLSGSRYVATNGTVLWNISDARYTTVDAKNIIGSIGLLSRKHKKMVRDAIRCYV